MNESGRREVEQQSLAAILSALGTQIVRRAKHGVTRIEAKYGWFDVMSVELQGSYPQSAITIAVRYSRDPSITTTESFSVWDTEVEGTVRTGPDVSPGVVLTNLEEWIATEAFFLAQRG